ncbi:MAG: sigma-70 family RNA polymerase sigma factor [Gemmataceae bacterium]|nr:sigma-70 family RNA polymerase sigma factor [Gemmataceae bacterium]
MPADDDLLGRLREGGAAVLAELFAARRARLRRMVSWRLDPRLNGRVDPSDVLQEAFLDAQRRLGEYLDKPSLPFDVWLRLLAGQRVVELHRQHLGAQKRSAGHEVSLDGRDWACASVPSLAAQLVGHLTSPSRAAYRAETAARLAAALGSMDPIDREVLVLRHFDELGNNEVAALLGLQKAAASNRYVRALQRLRDILATTPGLDAL